MNDLWTYNLAEIVRPWEEENARVVLFPVRDNKTEQNEPEDSVHWVDAHAVDFGAAKNWDERNRQKQSCPAVQAVIEEFAQRGRRAGAASLLTVSAV